VDVESTTPDPKNDAWRKLKPDQIIRIVSDWLSTVEKHKPKSRPIIYTVKSWWSLVDTKNKPAELELPVDLRPYRIWIADYGERSRRFEMPRVLAGSNPVLWQFTSRAGLTTGYNKALDASVFFGTPDEFTATMAT
jgi:GH25 family lysozyme M1 (1,4-beta-N-acetylmuramidase)